MPKIIIAKQGMDCQGEIPIFASFTQKNTRILSQTVFDGSPDGLMPYKPLACQHDRARSNETAYARPIDQGAVAQGISLFA